MFIGGQGGDIIMSNKGDENMLAPEITSPQKKKIRRPVIKGNKFANLTPRDWKESNESSKRNRGISGLSYKDIWR